MEKGKKLNFILIAFVLLAFLTSCHKNEYKYSDIAYFAEPVIQDFCAGFTKNDNNEFANYFVLYLSKSIPVENLEKLFEKIGNTIGSYVPDTVSYKSISKNKKVITVVYTAKFTDEAELVNITLNFEKINNDFKVIGFNVDSPKLRANQ